MPAALRVTREDIRGVLAIMPTPATPDAADPTALDTVDHDEAKRAVDALIGDGVNAILTTGTFGECATLTWEEHLAFATTVVAQAGNRVPVYVGATTLNTRDTIARARAFSDIGVSGLLLGRPMWSPCDAEATVGFYRDVAAAVPELSIIVYDNPVSFGGKIAPQTYARLAEIEQIVAAKYPVLGPAFLADLAAVSGRLTLLPVERDWYWTWRWAPDRQPACWSGSASCGPAAAVALRDALAQRRDEDARAIAERYRHASQTFFPNGSFELFSTYNVQLEKIRIDEAGYMRAGPSRPPYVACPTDYAEGARESGRRLAALHREYSSAAPLKSAP